MIALLGALALAAQAQGPNSDIGARIATSAAQAERLQGPLDGAWVVRNGRGRSLMRLEIMDPPQGAVAPSGAWSLADGSAMGSIERIEASRERLTVEIAPGERLTLRREPRGWRGHLTKEGRMVLVTLSRR